MRGLTETKRRNRLIKCCSSIQSHFPNTRVAPRPHYTPSRPRQCLFLQVSEGTTLTIKLELPQAYLDNRCVTRLSSFVGADTLAPAAQSGGTRSRAMNMSLTLCTTTGAIIAAPTSSATVTQYTSRGAPALGPALRLASRCQRLLSNALLFFLIRASMLASGLLHLGRPGAVRMFQTIRSIVYNSFQVSRKAAWALWDGQYGRRLRKKMEFEFFTLILGGGGNNLCLFLFWPGWAVLALVAFILSVWFTG
ncbi:hypothetical protein F5Y10DRAFT_54261 [Nemania abortiva]|nr:hypothetical protein F5Y10DRAFT_54261 [Nemania abortiva]